MESFPAHKIDRGVTALHGSQHQSSMFYNVLFLTAGSLALRLVQMIFQIYISKVMGAAGLGQMQLIMAVGGFATILASGGIRIAVTCLTAEEIAHPERVHAAVRCCLLFGGWLSALVALLLFFLAPFLAEWWIGTLDAARSLRIYACFLPITILWSVIAGYFTTEGRVRELVSLEIFERLLSIGLVVAGFQLALFTPCEMIFLGSGIATTASFAVLSKKYVKACPSRDTSVSWEMLSRVVRLTIPLGINDILRSGLNTVENIIVPKGLQRSGQTGNGALAAYGVICGMVFPVITFPAVLLYALSDLLVPEMARCRAADQKERIITLAERCLRMTVVYAVFCAGGCFLLGDNLGLLLFSNADAGVHIRIYAPLMTILFLDTVTDGMLKGLSQQIYTVRYNTATSLLDVIFLFLLLPRYGIGGFLFSFTVTHGINFFFSFRRLSITTGYLPRFHTTIAAAASCVLVVYLLLPICERIKIDILTTIAEIVIFGAGYFLLLLGFGAIRYDDVVWLRQLVKHNRKKRKIAD